MGNGVLFVNEDRSKDEHDPVLPGSDELPRAYDTYRPLPTLKITPEAAPNHRPPELPIPTTRRIFAERRSNWAGGISRADAVRLARTAAWYLGIAAAAWLSVVLVLIGLYKFVNPPFSMLTLYQRATGTPIRQTWVPLEKISPNLVRAVVLSEDARFCQHWGVDLEEIEAAIERARDGIPRGASTISMQVTKNLFLWSSKSYVRKAIELPLTFATEFAWSKPRMLEIYLNIAEWGPGVFGAEAAARYHFDKTAARLTEREAAQLAASLPNPAARDAGDPGPKTSRLATLLQSRMRAGGQAAACAISPD